MQRLTVLRTFIIFIFLCSFQLHRIQDLVEGRQLSFARSNNAILLYATRDYSLVNKKHSKRTALNVTEVCLPVSIFIPFQYYIICVYTRGLNDAKDYKLKSLNCYPEAVVTSS